jgi:hypothetical protein
MEEEERSTWGFSGESSRKATWNILVYIRKYSKTYLQKNTAGRWRID